jgi:DNA modification methylase
MNLLINANAKRIPLADNSVNCVVTSPPYYGLRSYLPDDHPQKSNEIGLEQSPERFIKMMVMVGRELWRVLRDDGTFWLNIGDSYAGSGNGSNDYRESGASISKNDNKYKGQKPGLQKGYKRKDLMLIPHRVAMALQNDGWWVRSDIVWWKNGTPESVKDRPTSSHEYVFLLSKSEFYYYDYESVKTPTKGGEHDKRARIARKRFPTDIINGIRATGYYPTANLRDVWKVSTVPYHGAHYAVFPPDLIEPCILAGCPEGGTVLDPFAGSGTTLMVARKHRRNAIGLDLNFDYLTTNARERLQYGSYIPVADGISQLTINV